MQLRNRKRQPEVTACARRSAGRHDDALRKLKKAARLAPEDVNVHWRLGRLYLSMGRKDEAKAEFEKASQVNKAVDQAIFDRINSEHNRLSQAQPWHRSHRQSRRRRKR